MNKNGLTDAISRLGDTEAQLQNDPHALKATDNAYHDLMGQTDPAYEEFSTTPVVYAEYINEANHEALLALGIAAIGFFLGVIASVGWGAIFQ